MVVEKVVTKKVKNNAIDMLVALIVGELSEDLMIEPDEAFSRFISSKTGELLYDEESKFWWYGPSYIVDMYKNEIKEISNN